MTGQVSALKEEGNKLFGTKDYTKAFASYEKAIKLLPAQHAESVLLHSNKAACSMMLKKCAPSRPLHTPAVRLLVDGRESWRLFSRVCVSWGLPDFVAC